jgi:hypothetical protein
MSASLVSRSAARIAPRGEMKISAAWLHHPASWVGLARNHACLYGRTLPHSKPQSVVSRIHHVDANPANRTTIGTAQKTNTQVACPNVVIGRAAVITSETVARARRKRWEAPSLDRSLCAGWDYCQTLGNARSRAILHRALLFRFAAFDYTFAVSRRSSGL